ncbi:response regulator transcription factor [Candidatus Acetothermia bacterium]|nr:response regulator transcription factor [Candidatus Acetothermia bacterium]
MTRVLVAASSQIVRAGLESLLAATSALSVVGSSSLNEATLWQQVEDLEPDVVVLQLEHQDEERVPSLLSYSTGPRVPAMVVLTEDPHTSWAVEALRSGVRAILSQEATASEIVAAVEAAVAGLVVLYAETAASLLSSRSFASRASPISPEHALTPREIEVLGMLTEGLGNKQIASRLGVSQHTVKFHIGSIFSKLHVSSRTEAVTRGIRQGLIVL